MEARQFHNYCVVSESKDYSWLWFYTVYEFSWWELKSQKTFIDKQSADDYKSKNDQQEVMVFVG